MNDATPRDPSLTAPPLTKGGGGGFDPPAPPAPPDAPDAGHLSSVTPDWLDDLTNADLPESLQGWAEIVGVRGAVAMAQRRGGEYWYIPKVDKLLMRVRDARIRREFTGDNIRELARTYKLSETWIREVLASEVDDRQASLFPGADDAPTLPP